VADRAPPPVGARHGAAPGRRPSAETARGAPLAGAPTPVRRTRPGRAGAGGQAAGTGTVEPGGDGPRPCQPKTITPTIVETTRPTTTGTKHDRTRSTTETRAKPATATSDDHATSVPPPTQMEPI